MEGIGHDIAIAVGSGVFVEVVAPDLRRGWEQGWERDREAGGISYREPDEGTVLNTVEVLHEKAVRQLLTRTSLA